MKVTDGKWEFRQEPRSGDCGIMVPGFTGVFIECFAEIRRSGENARDEAKANARLVCGAKELLEAAKQALVDACADGQDAWYERLQLAIDACRETEE